MSNPQHEPTMEEILASIRKIISEDAPEAASPEPAPPAPAPEAVHEDVLELTQEVEAVELPPSPAPAAQPAPADEVVFQSVAPAPSTAHTDIFSDHTRK